MRVAISHETVYRYQTPTNYSVQYLRLTPLSGPTQRVLSWKVTAPGSLSSWTDGFGNTAQTLVVENPHEEVRVTALGEVEIADGGRPLLSEGEPHAPMLFLRSTRLTQPTELVQAFAQRFKPGVLHNPRKGLDNLMTGIRETVATRPAPSVPATPACRTLEQRAGAGQDQSHLFVTCCRSLGVPARYVSGYLCTDTGKATQMSAHAWAEAWVEGTGWLSYDATNEKSNAKAHVRVAVGLDYLDAAPVRGFRRGGGEEIAVETTIGDARAIREARLKLRRDQQQ